MSAPTTDSVSKYSHRVVTFNSVEEGDKVKSYVVSNDISSEAAGNAMKRSIGKRFH